jgi:hypothetical protein
MYSATSVRPKEVAELDPELVKAAKECGAPFDYVDAYGFELNYEPEAVAARRHIRTHPELLSICIQVARICGVPRTRLDTRLGRFVTNVSAKPHIDNELGQGGRCFPRTTLVCVVGVPTLSYTGDFTFRDDSSIEPCGPLQAVSLHEGIVYEFGPNNLHSEPPSSLTVPGFRMFWRSWG